MRAEVALGSTRYRPGALNTIDCRSANRAFGGVGNSANSPLTSSFGACSFMASGILLGVGMADASTPSSTAASSMGRSLSDCGNGGTAADVGSAELALSGAGLGVNSSANEGRTCVTSKAAQVVEILA